ncbi:MAG: hypothetical protein E7813_03395 [Bradyrhizobium sp.]|uniref:hypothetical protein n=1 Tax=Bradyrhizobium sp. TaxID=376 RepID=UPI0012121B27|nr:hypothetical protein [Bradyrhizobium sp.]THD73075.1 MAG: hypothetical protein E7813_03395 [Bradyrhizobium sp.]
MIHILADKRDAATTEIVVRAFERSFTRGQVRLIDAYQDIPTSNAVVIVVSPDDESAKMLGQLIRNRGKIVLQGSLGPAVGEIAGVETFAAAPQFSEFAECGPAPVHGTSQSRASMVYSDSGIGTASCLRRRHFVRFDFSNEWNNLGYGRIGFGEDRWSIAQLASRFSAMVADVRIDQTSSVGAAVTLLDLSFGSVLWFARPAGAIDGQDWSVVENFISAHRANELPCRPFLRGIPHGFGAAVSMRLDCDEDIASARQLYDLYRSRNYPLSLAVMTGQPDSPENRSLMRDVLDAGGSILSHSATHAADWGGSGEAAEREARDSRAWLEKNISGLKVRYAVSPFHQNPSYVPGALARAGYDGFIGGSIAGDPEYLMARGGAAPFGPAGMISHSQSCMLHGDCMLAGDDRLRVFKEAFALARDSGEFFGYLDHPFSERYTYGWPDEETRLAAHSDYLDFLESASGNGGLLFVNEDTCMQFIKEKASAEIAFDVVQEKYEITKTSAAGFPMSLGYHGEVLEAQRD